MTRKILLLLFYTAISSIYSCFFLQSAEAISATHQSREQNDCALPKLPECCPIRQGPVIIEEGKLKTKLLFCPTSCEAQVVETAIDFKYADPDINTDIYQSNVTFGGQGGSPFNFQNPNALMTKLIVHRDYADIRGLQIDFSNNQSEVAGLLVDPEPISFESEGVQITQIIGYFAAESPFIVKGLELNTTAGIFQAFVKNLNFESTSQLVLPVGSGYCAGIFGRGAAAIDALGFAMLTRPPC